MKNHPSFANHLFFSSLLIIFIWLVSPITHANLSPSPIFPFTEYEARYSISWFGIPAGESVHQLRQRKDGTYHLAAKTEPSMHMLPYFYHESTDFLWEDGKFVPQNYHYHIKEGKRRKKGNVVFDWSNNKVFNNGLKEPWQTEITEGLQNKLTQSLCIRYALKMGQRDLHYSVAEEDKIKDYVFTIVGEENAKTKIGTFKTVKVEHVSRKGIRTTLWCAKGLDFIPVKMAQVREGKVVGGGEIVSFSPKRGTYAQPNPK